MVNKGSNDSSAKAVGTGAKSGAGIKSYVRGAKSFRGR